MASPMALVRKRFWPLAFLFALFVVIGCKGKTIEEREREAADLMTRSMKDVDGIALAQEVDAAVIKEVQEHLTTIHEYQGPINGKLDSVTINALQAFERSQDMKDDGLIDPKVRERLATVAKSPAPAGG
jgi:hypothetical protein